MQKNNFTLPALLLNYSISSMMEKIYPNGKVIIPEKIGDYKLARILSTHQGSTTNVALYKNNKGKKVIAKIWSSKFKDYGYFAIKNEAVTYDTLNKVIKRLGENIPKDFKNIKLPKFILEKESKNSFLLLIEWIEGKNILNKSNKEKMDIYFKVSDFFDYLTSKMTKKELQRFTTRNSFHYIVLYPFLFVKALINKKNSPEEILTATFKLIKSWSVFLKSKDLTLVHRDLHFLNILVSKKYIYIVDLELTCLTYKAMEFVITLKFTFHNDGIYKYVLKRLYKKYKDTNMIKLVGPLTIITAIHSLAANSYPAKRMKEMRDFLALGIKI